MESPRSISPCTDGEPKVSKQLSARQKAAAIARHEYAAHQSKVAFMPASQHYPYRFVPEMVSELPLDPPSNVQSESVTALKGEASSMMVGGVAGHINSQTDTPEIDNENK